jgi:drug/metabolite transporter (DMT)-like permease
MNNDLSLEPAMKNVSQNNSFSLLAVLSACGLCTLFGANAVAIKISLTGLGTFTAAAIRFTIASAAIILWAIATGRRLTLSKSQAIQMAFVSLCFTTQLSLFYAGLSRTYAFRGSLIANLQPFLVLILAHFFIRDDRITVKKLLGIVMGFVGVVFLFLEKKSATGELLTGDLLIMAAVTVWAGNAIYLKTIISAYRAFQVTLYPMIGSLPVLFAAGMIWDQPMVGAIDGPVVTAMLYQSLVTASFGFVAWNTMLQKYGAVTLHSFLFILPIAGVFFSGWILSEPVATPNILMALTFIVGGILVVHANLYRLWSVFIR